MGNTVFYRNVQNEKMNLTWKEILSEAGKKHSKEELEYALTAGMAFNTADESNMLKKWKKPWVFKNFAIAGLILIALLYGLFFTIGDVIAGYDVFWIFITVIPPIVIPLSVLFFLWELNIPKNISLVQTLTIFVVGGIISLVITAIINQFFVYGIFLKQSLSIYLLHGKNEGVLAPLSEEPGKFIAAIIFIYLFSSVYKKKIYGVTALVIGAAVGAGFGAFESVQYVFHGTESLDSNLNILFVRTLSAFSGHIFYCGLYSAVLGLACEKRGKKLSMSCFADVEIWIYFAISCFFHYLWNGGIIGDLLSSDMAVVVISIIETIIHWFIYLRIIKRCIASVVAKGEYQSGSAWGYETQLRKSMDSINGAQGQFGNQFPNIQVPNNNGMNSNAQNWGNNFGQGSESPRYEAPRFEQPRQESPRYEAPYFNQSNSFSSTNNNSSDETEIIPRAQVNMAAPNITIMCTDGELNGNRWGISGKDSYIIGRESSCDIRIQSTKSVVSRRHCKIFYNNGKWYIMDLGSLNGTYVNGSQISKDVPVELTRESVIRLSTSSDTFRVNF